MEAVDREALLAATALLPFTDVVEITVTQEEVQHPRRLDPPVTK